MEQPDDSKPRKPRRTKGTPSFQYRNRFAAAVIAGGAVFFAAFYLTPIYRISNEKFAKVLFEPTVEELERRVLFNFPAARTSQFIKDNIDDKENFQKTR